MDEVPKGWHSRGYLPHFDVPGAVQHVTFHLADSLPREAIVRMQRDLDTMPDEQQARERRRRIQILLDRGIGSCVLRQDRCAQIVEDTFLFGDGERYRLLAWVVMPNHVHVLLEQRAGWPLSKVVQSWKRHTSRKIHLLGLQMGSGNEGSTAEYNSALPGIHLPGSPRRIRQDSEALWQRDYWDRFIRDEKHFMTTKRYIEENPVAAGLCAVAASWRWGSARLGV